MSITEVENTSSSAAARHSVSRRRFYNDMPDKGLFLFVAVAGFAAILFLKSHDFNADLITVMSAALMIAYGVVAYNIPAVNMRLDRLGDNFYYLGFIYTLASLSSAIVQVQGSADIDRLIGSFGIALVTTIVGIAGRVMFVQMRSDLDEVEETVRRDLAKTAAELRGECLAAMREFQTVRTALAQTMQESSAAFAKACDANAGKLDELMQNAAAKLENAFEPGRTGAQQVNEQMQAVVKSVKKATDRISGIEVPAEKLNAQIETFVSSLEIQLHRVGSAVEDVGRRAAIPNEQLNSAMAEFAKGMDLSLARLARTVDGAERGKRRWFWPFKKSKAGGV